MARRPTAFPCTRYRNRWPHRGEALVEVRAFSINRGELRMLRTAADGWRPGWDFAGILRSDVDGGPKAGARVVGIRQGGTWSERVTVPEGSMAELPDGVSFTQAATLPTAGLTALRTLRAGIRTSWSASSRDGRFGRGRSLGDPARASGWCGSHRARQQEVGAVWRSFASWAPMTCCPTSRSYEAGST